MQKLEKNKQYEFTTMPITEQLILLVDSETDLNETPQFKDKKANAIIGALLADIFLLKKAGLVNNKVVVTTSEEASITYIDGFIHKLRHLDKKDLMENIIHEEKPVADGLEENIREKLLAEEWLVEKKGLIPFISQKEIQVDNTDVIKDIKETISNILAKDQEPSQKLIYLMALLYALDMLKNFTKEGKIGREERIRMNELLEEEYITKLIYNAVKNQPEPDSLKMIDMGPPGYIAGMGGLVPKKV